MNIFCKVALKGLKKNRTRTIVTIIGVVLSAAMFTAVTTFGVSLLDYMAEGAVMKYGSWDVGFLDADASFAQEQSQNNDVEEITTIENIGYAPLKGGQNPDKPYLYVAGFSREAFDALPITLTSGRLPENGNEVLISGKIATDGGVSYATGDTISLAVGNRMEGEKKLTQNDPYTSGSETFVPQENKTYTVVGICRTPVFEQDHSPGYTLITRSDQAGEGEDLSLFVTLKNPRQVYSYVDSTAAGSSYILNTDVLRIMGLSRNPGDRIFNAFMYSAGAIVIAIIMIGSIFLIYNSFSISLSERTRQIGILSSVGATAKQLRNSVLFEGMCIGAVGIPIGILTGLGSIWLVISVVSRKFSSLLYSGVPLTMSMSLPAIAGAAAVSIITILISAYIPAKKAVNMPVMECIRQTNEVKVEARAMKISRLERRTYGLEGILALKNFKRNKKRYRSIVMSLVLSIVLFVSTSALVTSMQKGAEQTKIVTSYDIGFGTQDMDDSEMLQIFDRLKTANGVTGSSYQEVINYSCAVKADELTDEYWKSAGVYSPDETVNLHMEIQFLDDNTYLDIVKGQNLPEEEYTGQDARVIGVAKLGDDSAEGVDDLADMFRNPVMNLTIAPEINGVADTEEWDHIGVRFVTMVPPDTPPMLKAAGQQSTFFSIIAPWSLKERLVPKGASVDSRVKGLTFQSDHPSQSADEMKSMIQEMNISSAYIMLNTDEVLEESRNYIFIANVFAYTFIIMISLIAVANVFNTISTNIKLRRRELAMLRSVGMPDRDFNKMMRFECAFYGIRALLFGIPISILSSWLICKGMLADDIRFVLPWGSIGISVISVLLVIFVTMMYAVSKMKKENIIDALRDDMA